MKRNITTVVVEPVAYLRAERSRAMTLRCGFDKLNHRRKLILQLLVLFSTFALFAQEVPQGALQTAEYPDFVTFMNEYNKTMFSSHKKLVLMNKPKKLQKLGKEVKNGDISGLVDYKTKVRGFSGIVIMKYENYCDFPEWIINGETNTKANMNANGKMFGTVNVSGKYNAKVIYDNLLIKKGNAGGGFYIVQYENGLQGKVIWNEIEQENVAIDDADDKVSEIITDSEEN